MMNGGTSSLVSISGINGPSSSPPTLALPNNLPFIQLEEGPYTDGTTYYIYDSALLQNVLHEVGIADSDCITLTVADDQHESQEHENEVGQKIIKLSSEDQQEQVHLVPSMHDDNTHDHDEEGHHNADDGLLHLKLEEESTMDYDESHHHPQHLHNHNIINIPIPVDSSKSEEPSLPTFYNDMSITLSNDDSEVHETYLPLSFDEASHFLFHGREECVISTDIPTIESTSSSTSSISSSNSSSLVSTSTTDNLQHQHINSNSDNINFRNVIGSPIKKSTKNNNKPNKKRVNEGETILRKVFKCPHKDCSFWAARGHRFHEHMCTHDTKRPFGCSQCTYETNWKSDVKKHIARMIERNSKEHETAVLTRISEEKVDISNYKQYLVSLDVPCYMYSGRVGEPSRSSYYNNDNGNQQTSGGKKKKKKKKNANANTNLENSEQNQFNFNDLLGLPSSTSSPTPSTEIELESSSTNLAPKPKKPKISRPIKLPQPKVRITPIVSGGPPEINLDPNLLFNNAQNASSSNGNSNSSLLDNHNNTSSEIIMSKDIFTTTEEIIETTIDKVIPQKKIKTSVNPILQGSLTTNDGMTINIYSTANQSQQSPSIMKTFPLASSPTISSTSKCISSVQPNKKSAAASKRLRGIEVWKCTNCTFTHSNKETVYNHLFKFHNLSRSLANPVQISSPIVPAKPCLLNSTSTPQQSFIRVGDGETAPLNQYFLVVENSFEDVKQQPPIPSEVPTPLKCDTCPFLATDIYELSVHRQYHGSPDENLTYSCPHCNFKQATRKDMEQHKYLHIQVTGRSIKLNDYTRVNTKRPEEVKNPPPVIPALNCAVFRAAERKQPIINLNPALVQPDLPSISLDQNVEQAEEKELPNISLNSKIFEPEILEAPELLKDQETQEISSDGENVQSDQKISTKIKREENADDTVTENSSITSAYLNNNNNNKIDLDMNDDYNDDTTKNQIISIQNSSSSSDDHSILFDEESVYLAMSELEHERESQYNHHNHNNVQQDLHNSSEPTLV